MLRPINVGGRLRSNSPQARLKLEDEISVEIAFHLAMRVEDNVEAGMSRGAAERAARAQFGDIDEIIAGCLDASDNHPLRVLRRRIVTVLGTGFGIGFATCLLLLAYSVLIRPPATYHGAGSWIGVWWEREDTGDRIADSSLNEYLAWQENNSVFSEMALAAYRPVVYDDGNKAVKAIAKYVSPGYLKQHGVEPHLGRRFHSVEPAIDGLPGIVLGYEFWKSRYDGDTGVVGQRTRIDGSDYVVVGVAPKHFRMYNRTDFWIPYDLEAESERWADLPIHLASGKPKPGLSLDAVGADLTRITPSRGQDKVGVWRVLPRTANEIYGHGASEKARLFAALAVILAVIMMVRMARETPRSVDLVLGGILAVAIAAAFISATAGVALGEIARRFNFDFGIDRYLLLLTGMLMVGMLLVRLPKPRHHVVGIVQTGAALAFTVAALLATSSSVSVDPEPDSVETESIVLEVLMPRQQFREQEAAAAYLSRLVDETAYSRSVDLAGVTRGLRNGYSTELDVRRQETTGRSEAIEAAVQVVDSSYFVGRQLRLIEGRLFSQGPALTGHRVAVISEGLARMLWQSDDPIGSLLKLGRSPASFQVTGVVSDSFPAVYTSIWQIPGRAARIFLRTKKGIDREHVVSDVTERIRDLDTRVAVAEADELPGAAEPRNSNRGLETTLWILTVTMLVLIWKHAGSTARHSARVHLHDIGIRKLLGASDRRILAAIVAPIARVASIGILVGSLLSFGIKTLAAEALATDSANYLWILMGGIVVTLFVTTLACAVPAVQAARLNPSTVLRSRDGILPGVRLGHATPEHPRERSRRLESQM